MTPADWLEAAAAFAALLGGVYGAKRGAPAAARWLRKRREARDRRMGR